MAIFAREQYAGRGQRGRTWVAAPGDNITMSVVLEPHFLSLSQQFQLSAALSLAIHDFLQSFTLTPFYIKWPNDLYWGDRKAAGILIESILKGDKWAFAVAGIGININQNSFPPGLLHAVSLQQVTGRHFEPEALARQLCECLQARYVQLRQEGFEPILKEYNRVLFRAGQLATLRKDGREFQTTILGVSEAGRLLTGEEPETGFGFGDIQWVIS